VPFLSPFFGYLLPPFIFSLVCVPLACHPLQFSRACPLPVLQKELAPPSAALCAVFTCLYDPCRRFGNGSTAGLFPIAPLFIRETQKNPHPSLNSCWHFLLSFDVFSAILQPPPPGPVLPPLPRPCPLCRRGFRWGGVNDTNDVFSFTLNLSSCLKDPFHECSQFLFLTPSILTSPLPQNVRSAPTPFPPAVKASLHLLFERVFPFFLRLFSPTLRATY